MIISFGFGFHCPSVAARAAARVNDFESLLFVSPKSPLSVKTEQTQPVVLWWHLYRRRSDG